MGDITYIQGSRYKVPFHIVDTTMVPRTGEQFLADYEATQANLRKAVPPTRWQRFRCWLLGHSVRSSSYADWDVDGTNFICARCGRRWRRYEDLRKDRWRTVG